jgi:DNA-binding MarR family transcriptional regulator
MQPQQPLDQVDQMIQAWARTAPGLDVSPLAVAGRLLRCAALLERSIEQALQPLGLSFADFDVLNTLRRLGEPAGTHPSLLAASALITSGAMTARLDRLERAGLIQRLPDAADRRAVRIRLTPEGAGRASRALHAVLEADRSFLDPLDDNQRRSMATTLKRLLLHAEAPKAGHGPPARQA